MRMIPSMLIAASLAFGVPAALADDIVIAPDVSMKFREEVKVKKIKPHKYEGNLKVGVVVPSDVEYYDVRRCGGRYPCLEGPQIRLPQ